VVFRAVQSDQQVAAKLAESLQAAGPLQFGHHLGEDRMEVVGADRVQQRPDMIVAGDPVETEQRLAVRPPLSLLQTTLMRQERRALQEEQGKRRQADVSHRIARVASLSEVRQRVAAPAQCPDKTIQDFHPPINHLSEAARIPRKRSSGSLVASAVIHRVDSSCCFGDRMADLVASDPLALFPSSYRDPHALSLLTFSRI
jgi:hypothetical protein